MSDWIPLTDEEKNFRKKYWTGPYSTMVSMVKLEGGVWLPERFLEKKDEIRNMEIRTDDVILLSYPKMGSTWSQEMLWQLKNGVDIDGGKQPLVERVPFLELETLVPRGPGLPDNTVEMVKNIQGPRIMKTSLPIRFLPPKTAETAKIIYVGRNPKDVSVSFYYHEKLLQNHKFSGSFDEYVDFFIKGQVAYGNCMKHLMEGWKLHKSHPKNVLFIWYEDMKRDLTSVMKKILKFCDWPEISDDQLEILKNHLEFRNFQKNPAVNMEPDGGEESKNPDQRFIRKGIVGDWKNHLINEDKNAEFDDMIRNFTKDLDINIPYE